MATLLDFLNPSGGLLGNFGGSFGEPDPASELLRLRQLRYGPAGGPPAPGRTMTGPYEMAPFANGPAYLGSDPFNFGLPPAQNQGPSQQSQPQQQPAMQAPSWLSPDSLAPVSGSGPAQSPVNRMPVSLSSPQAQGEPSPVAMPQQTQGGGFGNFLGNNALTLMALGGGIAQGGIGRGLQMAVPAAQFEHGQRKQDQAQAALFQALESSGLPRATALAIAQNPAAAKDFMPQLKETRKDPFSGKIEYTGYNPFTSAPVAGGKSATAANSSDLPERYDENGLDKAFLDSLEPERRQAVLAVNEGRMPATGRNLQQLMADAARYNRNFHAQDYPTMLQTNKSFAPGGKDAETVRRANQAIVHADAAWNLIPKVANSNIGGTTGSVINSVIGEGRSITNKQYQSDRQEYGKLVNALAGELRAAANGSGHGSLEEIRNWQQGALAASSGPEMRGSIRGAMDFLEGVTESMSRKKSEGMKSQFSAGSLLDPKNLEKFNRIKASDESGATPNAAVPAGSAPVIKWERGPDGKPRPVQ